MHTAKYIHATIASLTWAHTFLWAYLVWSLDLVSQPPLQFKVALMINYGHHWQAC